MSIKSFFEEIPKWLIALNIFILLPILLWPIIAFLSIFAMDSPSSGILGQIIFLCGISYPIVLVLITRVNLMLYKKNKAFSIFSTLLTISILYISILFCIIKIFTPDSTDM